MTRPPSRISAAYLERVTAHHLERFGSSRANLRRLLLKRVRAAAEHHGDDVAQGAALVEAELDRLARIGLLNDRRYATDKARALLRRGGGTHKIRAALMEKGLAMDVVDEVLGELGSEGNVELRAAATFARKRRLGPWRAGPAGPEQRRKELAKMGRAGFGYEIARRVLDAELDGDGAPDLR